ncbi:MAG: glycosyltransferase family 39 protein [Nitrospirota bacterium]|nr:MAG: glycosyltransferase family 39 protein [Nitrospirota bacterium]
MKGDALTITGPPVSEVRGKEIILLVVFINLILFPILYIFRFLDNNTLSSWQWVFDGTRLRTLYMMHVLSIVVSLVLTRVDIPVRSYGSISFLTPFFIVLVLRGMPELYLDTSRYVIQAKALMLEGSFYFMKEWGGAVPAWTDMPLVPFVYGLLFSVFGESREIIQIFNAGMFSITVYAAYRMGSDLFERETGFYASLILMSVPYIFIQVPFMMVDVAAMCFLTLSYWLAVRVIKFGGVSNIVLCCASIICAALSKYSTWPMLIGLAIIPLVFKKGDANGLWRKVVYVGLPVMLVMCAFLILKYDVISAQIGTLRSYQLPALGRWKESFISMFLFQSHPYIIVLTVICAWFSLKNRDLTALIPLWAFVFIIVFRIERMRYLMPLFPLLSVAASYGMSTVRYSYVKRYVAFGMLAFSMFILFAGYLPFVTGTSMVNIRDAGEYIDSLEHGPVSITVMPQPVSTGNTAAVLPILDLYTDKELRYVGPEQPAQMPEGIESTPLRFTWELDMTEPYVGNSVQRGIVALITGEKLLEPDGSLSPFIGKRARLLRSFEKSSGVFRFNSFIYVYELKDMS